MNTHRGRTGKIAASLGLAMSLLLLATCESSLLTEIREAKQAAGETGYYTVAYDGNGKTSGEVPGASSHDYGTLVTVSSPTGIRGPYMHHGITRRFVEWNTQPDGGGTPYSPSESFAMPGHDVTLYAIFTTGNDRVGNIGPAGGIVFYAAGDYEQGWRHMEAWPIDEGFFKWKLGNTETPGTSTDIGSGYANTYDAMIGTEHPAAEVVRNASYGENYDWFLPSRDTLSLMYEHRVLIGDFSDDTFYWSSSEYEHNDERAWIQHFGGSGYQSMMPKASYHYSVRAVRRF